MNHKPRVSIGLPVYNGERFLRETLDSLLAQNYEDFELIISDNASTDQTEDICHEFAQRDQRIQYYRNNENIGIGPNFNRVFELSVGEYFKWNNADDLSKPQYLARCVEVLDNDATIGLVYGKTIFIDESGKIVDIEDPGWNLQSEMPDDRLRYVLYAWGRWVNNLYGLIRIDALSKTRLMPSYPGGDYRLLGELSLLGKFYEIPEVLFLRKLHAGSSSQHKGDFRWMVEYHKGKRGRICLPFWNLSGDHFLTIARSNLGIKKKLSLVKALLRCMNWGRQELFDELKVAFKMCLDSGENSGRRS